jgi:hypothetical protein
MNRIDTIARINTNHCISFLLVNPGNPANPSTPRLIKSWFNPWLGFSFEFGDGFPGKIAQHQSSADLGACIE